MPRIAYHRNHGKTSSTPLRTFEAERIDSELKMLGEYGLKTKREVWRVNFTVAKIRKAARMLLTLPEGEPRRVFEGTALLRRLVRIGVLPEDKQQLDYVLGLTTVDFLKRRLQTIVKERGMAKSTHHARTLIFGSHVSVGKQVVTVPSFIVRVNSLGKIGHPKTSPFGNTNVKGRVARLKAKTRGATEE